jgi:hypothetical protein
MAAGGNPLEIGIIGLGNLGVYRARAGEGHATGLVSGP